MMRNTRDRLRHAIGFELIGLLIAAPDEMRAGIAAAAPTARKNRCRCR